VVQGAGGRFTSHARSYHVADTRFASRHSASAVATQGSGGLHLPSAARSSQANALVVAVWKYTNLRDKPRAIAPCPASPAPMRDLPASPTHLGGTSVRCAQHAFAVNA